MYSWWSAYLQDGISEISGHEVASVKIKNRYCANPSDQNGCLCRLSYASITLHYDGNIVAETTLGNTCGLLEIEWNEFIPNHDNSYVSAQPDTWYRT